MDAVQQANSGHPETPMAMAPLKVLQQKFGFTADVVVSGALEQVRSANSRHLAREFWVTRR